jgi:hypothetical protein
MGASLVVRGPIGRGQAATAAAAPFRVGGRGTNLWWSCGGEVLWWTTV